VVLSSAFSLNFAARNPQSKMRVPFGFAQGRLSTAPIAKSAICFAQDDSISLMGYLLDSTGHKPQ
jgi:hypothetical protein